MTGRVHPNEELLRSLYSAFGRGDISAAGDLFAEDAVFHQPGRNVTSGDYRGRTQVLRLLRTLGERSAGTFRASVHDVLGSDDHAVGLLRITAARGRHHVDMPVVHVVHVADGRIREVWAHPLDQKVIDEFWDRPYAD